MGGNVISSSSFKTLKQREQKAVEIALWARYKKLRDDKHNAQEWRSSDENIKKDLEDLRNAMKKLGVMK